jgi:hypothetical protein
LADYEPPKSTREKRAGREDLLIPMSNVAVGKASVRAVVCATGFKVFQLINSMCWKGPYERSPCCGSL